eukprot:1944191-Prymnesium_polylepis.1
MAAVGRGARGGRGGARGGDGSAGGGQIAGRNGGKGVRTRRPPHAPRRPPPPPPPPPFPPPPPPRRRHRHHPAAALGHVIGRWVAARLSWCCLATRRRVPLLQVSAEMAEVKLVARNEAVAALSQ